MLNDHFLGLDNKHAAPPGQTYFLGGVLPFSPRLLQMTLLVVTDRGPLLQALMDY